MELRFLSSNRFKIAEATTILSAVGVNVIPVSAKIEELQTENTKQLVKDKLLKAYSQIGHPIFVEHTGLYLDYINGLPGGLTQIFWDKLQADKFSQIFGQFPNNSVQAKTVVGYCNGRNIYYFEGEISGCISPNPRGNKEFQWDCVFIPEGYDKTFAELGDEKNKISMRRKALDRLAEFLEKERE